MITPPAFTLDATADGTERVVLSDQVHSLSDVAGLYAHPGLYDAVMHHALGCRSPEQLVRSLREACALRGVALSAQRVLDLGAGTGATGSALRAAGVAGCCGIDQVTAARTQSLIIRPGAYDSYLVDDLRSPIPATTAALRAFAPTAVVAAGALEDTGPDTLAAGIEWLPPGGLLVITIDSRHLDVAADGDNSRVPFRARPDLAPVAVHRFVHRRTIAGGLLRWLAVSYVRLPASS